jgi:hypothetical protein
MVMPKVGNGMKMFKMSLARVVVKDPELILGHGPGETLIQPCTYELSIDDLRYGGSLVPTVLIVQHTIVFKKPLFYHLAKYDHETWTHNYYNIANYEKGKNVVKNPCCHGNKAIFENFFGTRNFLIFCTQ